MSMMSCRSRPQAEAEEMMDSMMMDDSMDAMDKKDDS